MNEKPIRILHVLGDLNLGGAEALVMNIYRNIDRDRIQFDFVIHTENECAYNQEIRNMGGNIFAVPRYNGLNHLKYSKAWNRIFSEKKYNIIHCHVRSTAAIILYIAKRYGIYTISHAHNTSEERTLRGLCKRLYEIPIRYVADSFFACSYDAGKWQFGKRICSGDDFFILKNGISIDKFVYDESIRQKVRSSLNIGNQCVIGHVGRFDLQKNHKKLLHIYKELLKLDENNLLILVGTGKLEATIKEQARALKIYDKILWLGTRTDVNELMQAMDIFVFPSLFEGLGIVLIEAQAAGLPCIVSNTIPKEACISTLVEKMDVNKSSLEWAEQIANIKHNGVVRESPIDQLYKSGYCIIDTVKWLENFYLMILE